MKEFMMIFTGADYSDLGLSPEELQNRMGKWFAWGNKMENAGVLRGGNALNPNMRRIVGKNRTVTDLTSTEVKEIVGRHHSGKMVSVLTRIFGLPHLEIIEDAIQDTFIKASISWRKQMPENPKAWLTQAAKNRVLDIFRKLKTEKKHLPNFKQGIDEITINDLFLDSEIEDSQLRMIFTACHPKLDPKDRICIHS